MSGNFFPNNDGDTERLADVKDRREECCCKCCPCDSKISSYLCIDRHCKLRTEFNMNPFNPYVATIYPPTRAASVIPSANTNNNLHIKKCENVNCNFPGSSSDICTNFKFKNKQYTRMGIRTYKAGTPERTYSDKVAPVVPRSNLGMMNNMPPECMKRCMKCIDKNDVNNCYTECSCGEYKEHC